MREIIDFDRIPERQNDIHMQLAYWGRWCKPDNRTWMTSPMFRQYRSHAWQWEVPEIRFEGNPHDHFRIEKIVASLPSKHRDALRWYYVKASNPTKMANDLAVTRARLAEIVIEARDMVANILKVGNLSTCAVA